MKKLASVKLVMLDIKLNEICHESRTAAYPFALLVSYFKNVQTLLALHPHGGLVPPRGARPTS